jgi:hypothetical protein
LIHPSSLSGLKGKQVVTCLHIKRCSIKSEKQRMNAMQRHNLLFLKANKNSYNITMLYCAKKAHVALAQNETKLSRSEPNRRDINVPPSKEGGQELHFYAVKAGESNDFTSQTQRKVKRTCLEGCNL